MNIRIIVFILFFHVTHILIAQEPPVPEFKNVTLNDDGKVELSWHALDSAKVDGYIVVRRIFGSSGAIDGTYHDIETVVGADVTSFVDETTKFGLPAPEKRQESYRLKSYKMKGTAQVVSKSMSAPHNMIYLFPPEFERCKQLVVLKWNQYVGWESELDGYIIYGQAEGASVYEQVATVTAEDTAYIHETPTLNVNYEYYISGFNSGEGLFTRSASQTISTVIPHKPKLFNADFATIEGGKIKVRFTTGEPEHLLHYILERTDKLERKPETVDELLIEPQKGEYSYIDEKGDPLKTNYYRLSAMSVCTYLVGHSNWAQNIVASGHIADENLGLNRISWTSYNQWLGEVDRYEVFRQIDEHEPELVSTHTKDEFQVLDNVNEFRSQTYKGSVVAGKFCYWIKAVEKNNPNSGIVAESTTNKICLYYEKFIQIPNAINPKSETEENRYFKPNIAYVKDFSMSVYDRWGAAVFSTKNSEEGWDGTKDGNLVTPGVYIYMIEYTDSYGNEKRRRGQINVVY